VPPGKLYALTDDDVARLRAMLADWEQRPRREAPVVSPNERVRAYPDVEFGKADAVIAGTTTVTPNSGTVSVWDFTSTGGTTDTGYNVTAYNVTPRDINTEGFVQLQFHPRSGKWLAVHGAQAALMYYGLLQGALASSTAATATVDGLAPLDSTIATTAASLTVQNRLGWTGDDNGKCYVVRNMDQGTWDLLQLECT